MSRMVGSRSGGRLGEDANPNRDGTENRFRGLNRFFILALFFLLGRLVDLDLLGTDDVYCRKSNLEIPVSKLYDITTDIN